MDLRPRIHAPPSRKPLGRTLVTAALCLLAPSALRAADAPAPQNPIPQVLPWVGAPAPGQPASCVLKAGDPIVAIGDSITAAGGYLRQIDAALAQRCPDLHLPKIVNVGIGGQKAEDLLPRFQRDVVDRKPAVVTISIGINDVWHRLGAPHDDQVLATYKANVGRMVEMAQAAGIRVLLLAPTVIQENPAEEGNRRLVRYVEALRAVAQEKQCGLSDLHAMFLSALQHKPEGETGHWLTSDGVHMNPLGDAVMAVGVLRALGLSDQALAELK